MPGELDESSAPPHDRTAEQAALGGMLLSPGVVAEVIRVLSSQDFYIPAHQIVFDAITTLDAAGQPIDAITVVHQLTRDGDLARVGGAPYIHELIATPPTAMTAPYYAREVIKPLSTRRSIGEAAIRIWQAAQSGADNITEIAEQTVMAATNTGLDHDVTPISVMLPEALERLESGDTREGIATGLVDLDRVLGGMHQGQLVVVAARPAMGKSVLAADITRHAAIRAGGRVLFVSLEMSRDELLNRMLSAEGDISLNRITARNRQKHALSDAEWSKVSMAAGRLGDAGLWIDDTPNATVGQVRAKARRLASRNKGIDLVVVDYLQLMPAAKRSDNREREVAEISRGLKLLAKDLECPVIAVAQLNRGPESRVDKRPAMSDLRESGALEADADIVMLLHRDDYYDNESPRSGEIDIIVAKNRNGRTDTVTAAAQLHKSRIVSVA